MIYKDSDIQKLIDSLDIVEVIGEYVELKRAGSGYKGFSPFKEEKTPSFMVSPSKKIFKCFSSGTGGNVIHFYMKINHLDYISAIKELSKKYNIGIKPVNYINKRQNYINDSVYYKITEEAVNFYIDNLYSENGKEALKYLENRGFDEKFIREHKIGYALEKWDLLYQHLISKSYNLEDILSTALIKKSEKSYYDTFRERIIFPIYSTDSKVIAFGGRILTNNTDAAKYLNSPETEYFKKGENLYGILNNGSNLRKKGFALLMEGYMDVLTAHKYGFNNAIASLGTAFTDEQAKLIKRYTSNVVICYDMDEAGRNAVERAAYILKKNDFSIRVLTLSKAKDPDEFLNKFGKKEFTGELKNSKEIFEYLYFEYAKLYDLSNLIARKNFIDNFSEFFKNVNDKMEKSLYIENLSQNTNIDKDILNEKFLDIKTKTYIKQDNIEENENKVDILELSTLKICLKNKTYFNIFKEKKFKDKFIIKIFEVLSESIDDKNLDIHILNSQKLSEREKKIYLEILSSLVEINEQEYYNEIYNDWFRFELKESIKNARETNQLRLFLELNRLQEKMSEYIRNGKRTEELYLNYKNLIS